MFVESEVKVACGAGFLSRAEHSFKVLCGGTSVKLRNNWDFSFRYAAGVARLVGQVRSGIAV
jgi:hypothetical protein